MLLLCLKIQDGDGEHPYHPYPPKPSLLLAGQDRQSPCRQRPRTGSKASARVLGVTATVAEPRRAGRPAECEHTEPTDFPAPPPILLSSLSMTDQIRQTASESQRQHGHRRTGRRERRQHQRRRLSAESPAPKMPHDVEPRCPALPTQVAKCGADELACKPDKVSGSAVTMNPGTSRADRAAGLLYFAAVHPHVGSTVLGASVLARIGGPGPRRAMRTRSVGRHRPTRSYPRIAHSSYTRSGSSAWSASCIFGTGSVSGGQIVSGCNSPP